MELKRRLPVGQNQSGADIQPGTWPLASTGPDVTTTAILIRACVRLNTAWGNGLRESARPQQAAGDAVRPNIAGIDTMCINPWHSTPWPVSACTTSRLFAPFLEWWV